MYEQVEEIQLLLWKDDDRMDQETLFELQDRVADLAFKIASKENRLDRLIEKFKWIYS